MRRTLVSLLAVTAFAGLAAPAPTATTKTVTIGDNYYVRDGSAPTVTVRRNTKVKWVWRGDSPHNVTVSRGPVKFKSKTMTEGSYPRTMTRSGTYRIYCTIHGREDQSMTLKVK